MTALAAPQPPQPDLTFAFADWNAPDLFDAARVWAIFETIITAIKITPPGELPIVTNAIVSLIETEGVPRVLRLAELAALHGRCAATPVPN